MATVKDRGRPWSFLDQSIPTKERFAATNEAVGRRNGSTYIIPAHPAIFGDTDNEPQLPDYLHESVIWALDANVNGGWLNGEQLSISDFLAASGGTFTSTTLGMAVDENGILDYGPHNLAFPSEDFTGWGIHGAGLAAITANYGEAPNGTMTADRMLEAGNGWGRRVEIYDAIVGEKHIQSLWVKSNTGQNQIIDLRAFDGAGGVLTPIVVTPEWQRVFHSFTAAGTYVQCGFSADADGTDADILIWGAQWERSTYRTTPRDYIPTTNAPRNMPRVEYNTDGVEVTNVLWPSIPSDPLYVVGNTATIDENFALAPDGSMTASRLNFAAPGDLIFRNLPAGHSTNVGSAYVKGPVGAQIDFYCDNGERSGVVRHTFSGEWERVSKINNGLAPSYTYFENVGLPAVSFLSWGWQLQPGTTVLGRYVPTETAPRTMLEGSTVRGFLIEAEQRSNLCEQSQAFNTWTMSSGGGAAPPVVTANAAIAPDGTLTADQLTLGAVTSGQRSNVAWGYGVTAAQHTFSVWLRGLVGGEQTYIAMTADAVTFHSKAITLTTEWQRFEVSGLTTNTTWYLEVGPDLRDPTQTAKGETIIQAWGAQIELGATASSYIPNVGTLNVRSAEELKFVEVDDLLLGGDPNAKGTMLWEGDHDSGIGNFRGIWSLNDGGPINEFSALHTTPTDGLYIYHQLVNFAVTPYTRNTPAKLAYSWDQPEEGALAVNGALVEDGQAIATANVTQLQLAMCQNGSNNGRAFNRTKVLAFIPERLSNAELVEWTTS